MKNGNDFMDNRINANRFYAAYASQLAIQFVYFSMSVVDGLMLAQVDNRMMAGVGQGAILFNVVLSFFGGFLYVAINLYNQSQASKNPWDFSYIFKNIIILCLAIFPFAYLGIFTGGNVFYWMKLPAITSGYAVEYSRTLAIGAIVTLTLHACLNLLRSENKNRTAVYAVIIGSVLNFLLNIVMIKTSKISQISPHVGVGIATLLSEVSMLIFVAYKLKISSKIITDFKIVNFIKNNLDTYKTILKKGIGIGITNLNDWLLSFVLVLLIAKYGESVIIANQSADTFSSFLYRFVQAGASTIALLMAQSWGHFQARSLSFREFKKEVYRSFFFTIGPVFVAAMSGYFFREQILGCFAIYPQSPSFNVALTLYNLHLMLLVFYICQHLFSSLLSAMLVTEIQGATSFVVSYLIVLPIALISVKFNLHPSYIWISESFGILIISIIYGRSLLKAFQKMEIENVA